MHPPAKFRLLRKARIFVLTAKILVDNLSGEGLLSEWGFCVYITYNGKNYLLDTGSSDKYLTNAHRLGVALSSVDAAVLSQPVRGKGACSGMLHLEMLYNKSVPKTKRGKSWL